MLKSFGRFNCFQNSANHALYALDYIGNPEYITLSSQKNIFPTRPKTPEYSIDCYTKKRFDSQYFDDDDEFPRARAIDADPYGNIKK